MMSDANSQELQRDPSAAMNGRLTRSVKVFSESARRAEAAIHTHPYFAAGVLAGVGLAIGGALVLRARRRPSFIDVVMERF
jgi:ElaB/YqjD/DUF883 family membrane-anchored ribosome-binding protein